MSNSSQGKNGGLRLARFMRKVSQDDLAVACKVDQALISRIERGVTAPTEDVKKKICAVLGYGEEVLFPGAGK